MKDVQQKLLAISTTLTSLVKQVEKIATAVEKENGKVAPAKKVTAAKKVKKKAKAVPKKRVVKKAVPAKAKPKAPAVDRGNTMLDNIFGIISRSRSGITVERLKNRTGLAARQVSNALYKLTKKGKIETLSRGLYVKKKK